MTDVPDLVRVALTRLVERRAMMPSVTEIRLPNSTAVCTKGAKLT